MNEGVADVQAASLEAFAATAGGWCVKSLILQFAGSAGLALLADPLVASYLSGSDRPSPELIDRLCREGVARDNPTFAAPFYWKGCVADDIAQGRPEIPASVIFAVEALEQWEDTHALLHARSLEMANAVAAAYNASQESYSRSRAHVFPRLLWG